LITGGFTTLVGFVLPAGGGFVPPAGALGTFEPLGGVLGTFVPVPELVIGLPVILSTNNFVPAPIAAPVTAFTTLLVMEFVFVFVGGTVGFFTIDVGVVLVVGVVVVLFVIVGFVAFVGGVKVFDVSVGLVVVGFVIVGFVTVGLLVKVFFGTKEVLEAKGGFVVTVGFRVVGLVIVEVNGRLPTPAD
jgi:hypothetical protein